MRVYGWEYDVVEAVNRWPRAVGLPLEVAMQFGTRVAIPVVALAVAAATKPLDRRAVLALLLAGIVAWGAAESLKDVADRPRPAPAGADVRTRDDPPGFGLPSSHAAVAAALAATVPKRWRRPAVAVAVATALGRLYVGVHFPLDVLAGLAIGAAVGLAATTAIRWRPRGPA